MQVRVIYYDLSEWFGTTKNFNESPHKGVLSIMVSYPEDPYRHKMDANDYYYVKDKRIGEFNGEDQTVKLVVLNGPNKETVEETPVKDLDLAFLRMGVWVTDRVMRVAAQRILEREE